MKEKWKKTFLYIFLILCILVLIFSLSGFFMAGSFSVPTFADQERYDFLIKIYLSGIIGSILSIWYLLKKINISK